MESMGERPLKKNLPFPATRFYGSKRQHLDWIRGCLAKFEYETVLDLFGGTGSVSMLFESMGKQVYYHDSARFNYRQARGLFGCNKGYDFSRVELSLQRIRPMKGFISRAFPDCYFTGAENNWLDGYIDISSGIDSWMHRDILFYCVAQACLQKRPFNLFHRKNLALRLNKHNRTFGNAATWERSFSELGLRHLEVARRYIGYVRGAGEVATLKPAKPTAVESGWDLVYLDPPYLRADRHTESYVKRYHFLDGLSDPLRWQRNEDLARDGLFQSTSMSEPWTDKSRFSNLLDQLLAKHCNSIVAMSYMDGGVPASKELREKFNQYFSRVKIFTKPVQRALSNLSGAELLIVGQP